MVPISFKSAAEAVGSKTTLDGKFNSISTDSRKIQEGCLFIALEGDNFDGHDYAKKALELGASAVMVHKDCGLSEKQILVKDTRIALLGLAGYYRSLFNIPFVGVTGSVGKTTTKEMVWTVLSSKYKTLKNEGNLNNEIGVPLTLFRLDETYEAAVIEMGMSHFNEISRMTKAVKPDVALITNIGVSHIENLGSREGILKAKMEILEGMNPDAPIILNGDDDMLSKANCGTHPVTYYGIENSSCAFKARNITSIDDEITFDCDFGGGSVGVCLPFVGRHYIYNSLAAVAVGEKLGVDVKKGLEALKNYKTTGFRQKMVKRNGITFIEDCYNASPDSQAAAMSVLKNINAKRKIAVIGDMLELGDYSETAHKLVGQYAVNNGIDILFTCGEKSLAAASEAEKLGLKDVRSYTDKSKLSMDLYSELKSGDAVLFKASRGMKLEDVIFKIYDYLDKK